MHCGKVGQFQRTILLRGAFNPHIDFAAERPKIDRLGQQHLGTVLQRLALGLWVAIIADTAWSAKVLLARSLERRR